MPTGSYIPKHWPSLKERHTLIAKRATLHNLAAAAGVSLATASQVMRGAGRISEETRERVQEAARRIDYVPDGRAAAMRSGQVREVGLLVHHLANPFNAEVVSGVTDYLDGEGYLVSTLDSRDDAQRQRRQLEMLVGNARAGIIWVPSINTSADAIQLLRRRGVPNVTFLRHAPAHQADHVGIQNRAAARTLTAHLADLGHRRIAFLGGNLEVESRHDRIAGYRDVLEARALPAPIVWPCPDSRAGGMTGLSGLIETHPDVTAVVCNGDTIALGAITALARRGAVAGRDISITGFDGIEEAFLAVPRLTTISISPYELGRKLADTILNRIRNPDQPYADLSVNGTLILGATSGPLLA